MLSVVIQAGGQSTRMGEDKALKPFLGRPLIQRVVERLTPVADEILVTTMEHCAQCNTCSDACHIYEASGRNELYRPNYRSEIFRRLYKKHVKKELLSAWRNGDVELN